MSNDIIASTANLPEHMREFFDADAMADDLTAGVAGGFGIISFRGKNWRFKHSGEETLIRDDDGEPSRTLELVFLKASPHISKVYYTEGYVEGSDQSPTCAAVEGIKPDDGVESPQATSCAACEHNQWGSRMTDDGRKAKACQDSRRIAVVPAKDLMNETYDGPVLLRVPAASLNDLKTYGNGMKARGMPYNVIVTKLGFDPDPAYPKLTFKPMRPLKPEELEQVGQHYVEAAKIETILSQTSEATASSTAVEHKPPAKEPTVSFEFEQEAPEPAKESAPEPAKKPAAKKANGKAKPAPEPEPVAEPETNAAEQDALGSKLDSMLSDLDL